MDTDNKLILKITTLIVVIVAIISIFGMVLYKDSPTILQGEVECTQIKISGKLLGRIEKFNVKEGDYVKAGDTLLLINSPEADALMLSASAMKDAAAYENRKIDKGAREQITASLKEAWLAAQAQAIVAASTNERIERLYKDSVAYLVTDGNFNYPYHPAKWTSFFGWKDCEIHPKDIVAWQEIKPYKVS